jgi:hypothetical protein
VWYSAQVLRTAVAVVALAGLGAFVVWPSAGPARGDVLAARKAVRLVTAAGKRPPGRWQAWANAALVPTVKGRVELRVARCPRARTAAGCVITKHPRVVYVAPGLRNPRGVLLHELGHVYDLTVMSDRDRDLFRRIMRQPKSRQWWIGRTPLAEWFAEGYSWCARYAHIVSIERYAIYHYRPSASQHTRTCALIKAAARDRTRPVPPKAPPVVTGDPPPPPPPALDPGVVPGDPQHDPGPAPPEHPQATPTPTPLPELPLPPLPTPTPTATATVLDDPPLPWLTPDPSETPEPSPTSEPTPDPTETPEPTETAEPTPTTEPEPTPTTTPRPRH